MGSENTEAAVASGNFGVVQVPLPTSATANHGGDKEWSHTEEAEQVTADTVDLVYDNADEEPELHACTYVAVAAIFILYLVQVMALQGPPAVLSYIAEDLNGEAAEAWVANSLNVVQVVLCPLLSSIADTFQIRKTLIIGSNIISFIGTAIAPGSKDIYRLIAAQTLIGFGFSTVPLMYCIPSEILPRKWRPMAQAIVNIGACLGAVIGPLSIGSLVRSNKSNGWRTFYWIEMALFGAGTIGVLVGYRPPKRHTRYDRLSIWQKIGRIDLVGSALLTVGLTLLLTGVGLGGELYKWTNVRVLATLITGVVGFLGFCLYEWKGTSTGILHHGLFNGDMHAGGTFALCIGLIMVEGLMLFAYVIFYPSLTKALFETDPFLLTARGTPFWIACGISTIVWGYLSTRFRTIREPMFAGFLVFTAGVVGMATTQPSHSTNLVIFAALTGIGFGAPLILVVAAVQLSSPHDLIVTATAVMTSARGVGASIFIAIYSAVVTDQLHNKVPKYISKAVLAAGLPPNSIRPFVQELTAGEIDALVQIPGVTSSIISTGALAMKSAYADSLRVVFIIAAPFGALACIASFFIMDVQETMNYRVDAPLEDLHARTHHGNHRDHHRHRVQPAE